jgi:hypothetical protein
LVLGLWALVLGLWWLAVVVGWRIDSSRTEKQRPKTKDPFTK